MAASILFLNVNHIQAQQLNSVLWQAILPVMSDIEYAEADYMMKN